MTRAKRPRRGATILAALRIVATNQAARRDLARRVDRVRLRRAVEAAEREAEELAAESRNRREGS